MIFQISDIEYEYILSIICFARMNLSELLHMCGRKYFNVTINTTYNIANTPSILKILKYTQHKYIVQE
jgi:hypothetical protein